MARMTQRSALRHEQLRSLEDDEHGSRPSLSSQSNSLPSPSLATVILVFDTKNEAK